ncbi:hypothetical protein AJ79_03560 [Helicocarpus griseus UAMH5409]|uniref:Homeobox domain-containing protein n=1 Tax=Helicocarpus griseus UAMH5409 TaxID=1447875 RepID=A0A2B7XYL8_9EURO|nr:hypothetical protein AJ79_03560 [Helicocarpus griseus UAMH5409]
MPQLMAPISMHQAVTGWHNQQLESRQTVSQPRNFGSFQTVMKGCDFLEADPMDHKDIGLKIKAHFASSTTCQIKEDPTMNTKNVDAEPHDEIVDKPETNDVGRNGKAVSAIPSPSARSSSGSHLTSNSASGDNIEMSNNSVEGEGEGDCENEIDMEIGDDLFEVHENQENRQQEQQQQQPVGEDRVKTAAERRAEKRKMKRFRLTHNQTRFLMSEFTRQAHPDAAHRERLSREIPGLSPRQVQVWFQNRRAKLKRLTSDDRERMLKSRALPDDFDMAQALHSPYGSRPQSSSTITSPGGYFNSHQEGEILSPLMIDSIRRSSDEEYVTSPLSATSGYGGYFPSPTSAPAPGSEPEMSPITTGTDRAALYTSIPNPQVSASRHMNLFTRSSSFSNSYSHTSHPHVPRLQLHDSDTRSRAGSLGSPLRTSISYAQATLDYGAPESALGLSMPYGAPTYDSPVSQASMESTLSQPPNGQLQDFGTSKTSSLRLRTAPTSLPAELQVKAEYKDDSGLQSAPLPVTASQEDIGSPLSPSFGSNPFSMSYGQHNSSSMSLPASFFPFHSNGKLQDDFPNTTNFESGVNMQSPLDGLRGRAYSNTFEYSGAK